MSYIGKAPIDRTLGLSQKNVFTGDGSTVSFDMSSVAVGDTAVDVFIDNVRQEPGAGKAYVLASDGTDFKRITFNTAPVSGAVIWVLNRLRTQITNTLPSDGSVTTAMIGDNQVTGPKIAMGSDAQGDFIYYSGTDYVRLATGTVGQAILSGGAGANPSWGSAGDFKDGGDAGGANRTLGNTDDFSLGFETNNIDRLNIAGDGFAQGQGGFSMGNTQTITTTVSTPASENTMSVGPVTIDAGVTVTIGASSYWTIV